MLEKRTFVQNVLDHLRKVKAIGEWRFAGGQDRHDYEVTPYVMDARR